MNQTPDKQYFLSTEKLKPAVSFARKRWIVAASLGAVEAFKDPAESAGGVLF